jgi:hypothetical protein
MSLVLRERRGGFGQLNESFREIQSGAKSA